VPGGNRKNDVARGGERKENKKKVFRHSSKGGRGLRKEWNRAKRGYEAYLGEEENSKLHKRKKEKEAW